MKKFQVKFKTALLLFSISSIIVSCHNSTKVDTNSSNNQKTKLDTVTSLKDLNKDSFYFKASEKKLFKMKSISRDSVFSEPELSNNATSSCKTGTDCIGDAFAGQHRKAAKTSIFHGDPEEYDNVDSILSHLPASDDAMINNPDISEDCSSERTSPEKHFVSIKTAFIYGIYREADNDFHMIIGNGEKGGNGMQLLNVEIAGLPDESSPDYQKLKEIRDKIISKFGDIQCKDNAYKTADLIPISIEGSLFYDIDHAPGKVGFTKDGISYHPTTAWEIHPASSIIFSE